MSPAPRPPRRRLLRILKWIGISSCAALAVAFCVGIGWIFQLNTANSNGMLHAEIGAGRLFMYQMNTRTKLTTGIFQFNSESCWPANAPPLIRTWQDLFGWPRFGWIQNGPSPGWSLYLPLWIPFVLVLIPTIVASYYPFRRRYGPHQCRRCGYDLTANQSGVCPECGRAVAVLHSQPR